MREEINVQDKVEKGKYSITINEEDKAFLRYCLLFEDTKMIMNALYDPGSQITTAYSEELGININEKESFIKDRESITIRGIIKQKIKDKNTKDKNEEQIEIKAYKYLVNYFYFGNIEITGVDLWIYFDERIRNNVVGMDVIRRLNYYSITRSDTIVFFNNIQHMCNTLFKQRKEKINKCIADIKYIGLNKYKHNEIKSQLLTKGYTEDEIKEAFQLIKMK